MDTAGTIDRVGVRYPCVHGDVCRLYWNRFRIILTPKCPKCEWYEPKIEDRK